MTPAIWCGLPPMMFGSKAIKLVQGKTSQITNVCKNQRRKGWKQDNSCPSACNFMLMMELRKKIITFRDIIDLPPCNTTLSTDRMIIRTMHDLHKYYPESIPRYRRKKFKRLPLDKILICFYKALQDLVDMSSFSNEGVDKSKFDTDENEDCKNVEYLVEIVLGTLNVLIKMAREKSDMVKEDEENEGLGPKTTPYSEKSFGYRSPISVLPEYMDGSLKSSYASPLVLDLDVQAVQNMNPVDLKQLKLHMVPNIEHQLPSFLKQNKVIIEEHDEEENGGVVDESNNQNETSEDPLSISDNESGERTTDGSNVAPTTPSEVKHPELPGDIEVAEDKPATPPPATPAEVVEVVEDVSTPQQPTTPAEVVEVVEDVSTPQPLATPAEVVEVVEDVSTPQPSATPAEVVEVVEDVSTPQPPATPAEVVEVVEDVSTPQPLATPAEVVEVVEDVSTPQPSATPAEVVEVVEDVSTPQPPATPAEVVEVVEDVSTPQLPPATPAEVVEVVEDVSTPQPPPATPAEVVEVVEDVSTPQPPPATPAEVVKVVEDVSTPQPPPATPAEAVEVVEDVSTPQPPPATQEEVVEVVEDVSTPQPPATQADVLTPIPPPLPPKPQLLQPNVQSRKPPMPPPQPNVDGAKSTLVAKKTEFPSPGSALTKTAATGVPSLPLPPPPAAPSKPNFVSTPPPPAPPVISKGELALPPPAPPVMAKEALDLPPPPTPPVMDKGAPALPPPPPPTSALGITPPYPPPVMDKGAPDLPPPPPPTSASGTTPPPPLPVTKGAPALPPPPPTSASGTAPPLTPPMMPSKGSGPAAPPPPGEKGGAPPPPAPGALHTKKPASKLKRSSNVGNLYRKLKGKVEGVPVKGTSSSNGKKSGGGNNGGGSQQGMADALLEMTKRSKHYIQIEEDAQKYEKSIKELRISISTFKTKDMPELLKFHKYVESILENLADETQVLARFEGFPDKKLEALRIASALYSKLESILNELQNWKIEPPLSQLLDKVERYFDKIKVELDALERNKDAESKKLKGHNIDFDFQILVRIKESLVDLSSNCMELALKERKAIKLTENEVSKTKSDAQKKAISKLLWRSFQFAFRVYTFVGGHDDRAEKLTRELAKEIETDHEEQQKL